MSLGFLKVRRLRWRCRRGSLELDRLLMSYLEQGYSCASDAERLAFEALLALDDLVLARYLFGSQVPACPIQQSVIKKIAVFQNQ